LKDQTRNPTREYDEDGQMNELQSQTPTTMPEGLSPDLALLRAEARIRQLRAELASRREENEAIIAENLRQNEALRAYSEDLGSMVKLRTWELEVSKHRLELQAQQLRDLGETKEALMHMLVHDMKNPLTAVIGTLALFKKHSFDLKADMQGLLLDAHGQAIKLLSMIEEILIISRMRSKEFQIQTGPVSLPGLVAQSVGLMEKTLGDRRLALRCDGTCEMIRVLADGPIIERVLNNLLNNAIKYAPAGSEILIAGKRSGESAEVSVTNWGDPIPEAYHEKMFDLFVRVKAETAQFSGTGLGLTFCKLAVEAHGGAIWVESPVPPESRGARFVFTLPLAPQDPPPSA
jgi:two-component system, sensor histidine kinase and response regulator